MPTKNKKVLLAEHDKPLTEILTYLLSAWDYEVVVANDGISALELVRREQPDIIIVDFRLPKLDGLEFSKVVKEDFLTVHMPVIILIDKKQIRKRMLEIEQGVDDYIVSPPDPIDLEVRLEMALRRTAHQLHANALTRLPGNRRIERVLQENIENGEAFSMLYYDIDNFKSFNDKYGYIKGDGVIRHTAHIISTTVKKHGDKEDFVGHIGGDDFVVVSAPGRDKVIASESILSFNRLVPFHYNKEDRERGHIVVKDRRSNIVKTPLMSLSIAIANNKEHKIGNIIELMEIASEIKRYLKTLPGSNFLVNRRRPIRKEFIDNEKEKHAKESHTKEPDFRYKPLGQMLLESGVITLEQLDAALDRHWNTGHRIGQSIIDMGAASPGDVTRALERQLNTPHFDIRNLDKNGELKKILDGMPVDLMKDKSVIPVDKRKNSLSVVMLNPRDVDTISRVREFVDCSVVPFFVLENEFNEIWDKVMKNADKGGSG